MSANEGFATGEDRTLVRLVLTGDRHAAERLLRRIGDAVWTACTLLIVDEVSAREAFSEVMADLQAERFARFRPYDGRSRIEVFAGRAARDLLGERLLRLFVDDNAKAWRAFERFFEADIKRLVMRRLPGPSHEETRRDAYQEICMALVDKDFRRLRAYTGQGSFTGYVLHIVDRLLIDFVRTFSSRRRLPVHISRMTRLEQEIFRLIQWEGASPDPSSLVPLLTHRMGETLSANAVEAALAAVRRALAASPVNIPARTVSIDGMENDPALGQAISPEDELIGAEGEMLLTLATQVLAEAAKALSEPERLYLRIALGGPEPLSAREVARLMACPVEEIYKLKQRVMKKLKSEIADNEAVKNWRMSV